MRLRRGRSFLGTLFAIVGVLVVLFLGIGYGRGWIQFTDSDERVNIEIDKNAAKQDADDAIKETKDALKEAGDKITEVANDLSDSQESEESEESEESDDNEPIEEPTS